jgi:hypothetical protein
LSDDGLFDVYASSHLVSMFYIVVKDTDVALRRFYYWGQDPIKLESLIYENLQKATGDYQRMLANQANIKMIESVLAPEETEIIVGESLSHDL